MIEQTASLRGLDPDRVGYPSVVQERECPKPPFSMSTEPQSAH